MQTFWKIEATAAQTEPAHIHIYDVIGRDWWSGEGVSAKQFASDLAAVKGRDLVLHLNSAGGDVFEGLAMLTALDQHQGSKTVIVESLAASMASVLAMAATDGQITMARNAYMMIHNPRGGVHGGQAKDLRRLADLMDSLRGKMVAAYRRHSSLSEEELAAALDAETWYDAEAAVAAGLADQIVDAVQVAAQLDAQALAGREDVPEALKAMLATPPPDPASEELAAARAAAEASATAAADLEARLQEAESASQAAAAAVTAAESAAAAAKAQAEAAQAEAERQAAEMRGQVETAKAEAESMRRRVLALTGGLMAPDPGGTPAAEASFRAAVDQVRSQHPEWDHYQCWSEAKKQNPELWKRARG